MNCKRFGLINLNGKCVGLYETDADAWFCSFDHQERSHQDKFWKKPEESQADLKSKGWTVVPGKWRPLE